MGERGLDDTGGFHSGAQHVLLRGNVAGLNQPLQVIQIAVSRAKLRHQQCSLVCNDEQCSQENIPSEPTLP